MLAESRTVGAATATSLSACDLSHGGVPIGVGTVRTFYIAVSAPAAPAALDDGRDAPLRTASLRVNYLRRLISGGRSHYTATPLHSGRSSGVADAQAFDSEGRPALVGRLTAYL